MGHNLSQQAVNQIERSCERLSIAYANYLDSQRYDEFAELFTEQAVLNAGTELVGREAIRAAMHRRTPKLRSRHVLTNILVEVADEYQASGVTYLSLYRHIGEASLAPEPVAQFAPAAIGEYVDQYEKTASGWRIASRVLSFAFQNHEAFIRPKPQSK